MNSLWNNFTGQENKNVMTKKMYKILGVSLLCSADVLMFNSILLLKRESVVNMRIFYSFKPSFFLYNLYYMFYLFHYFIYLNYVYNDLRIKKAFVRAYESNSQKFFYYNHSRKIIFSKINEGFQKITFIFSTPDWISVDYKTVKIYFKITFQANTIFPTSSSKFPYLRHVFYYFLRIILMEHEKPLYLRWTYVFLMHHYFICKLLCHFRRWFFIKPMKHLFDLFRCTPA